MLTGGGSIAEQKAHDPLWTAERIQAVIAKIHSEYETRCERELDRMIARDMATVIAQIFQLGKAYAVSRRTDTAATDLAREVAAQHRFQTSGVSQRLKKLKKRRRKPL